MSKIEKIKARQIFDSRGNPTIEVDMILETGHVGRAAVPSGASIGSKEAIELRDGESDYHGRSVFQAVKNVNGIISQALTSMSVEDSVAIDQKLIEIDGSENKSNLGANALLGCSIAARKALANLQNRPLFEIFGSGCNLPIPMMNVINGGSHANNALTIQEFMFMPIGASSFSEAMKWASEVFFNLKNLLLKKNHSTNVGDEGGFAPNLKSSKAALDLIMQAIELSGLEPGKDMFLSIDAAANEFYRDGAYLISEKKSPLSNSELVDFYVGLVKNYPIVSLEDPMAENDLEGWKMLNAKIGTDLQIVGDDLFVTNQKILRKYSSENLANAILIKPNQIGTIFETFAAIDEAKNLGYNSIISHRSGETEDTTIAHLAVGKNVGQIKTGSICRSDRVAKYNELLRIEEFLGKKACYAGKAL